MIRNNPMHDTVNPPGQAHRLERANKQIAPHGDDPMGVAPAASQPNDAVAWAIVAHGENTPALIEKAQCIAFDKEQLLPLMDRLHSGWQPMGSRLIPLFAATQPPAVLCQDEDNRLSKALSNLPNAREHARDAAAQIKLDRIRGRLQEVWDGPTAWAACQEIDKILDKI